MVHQCINNVYSSQQKVGQWIDWWPSSIRVVAFLHLILIGPSIVGIVASRITIWIVASRISWISRISNDDDWPSILVISSIRIVAIAQIWIVAIVWNWVEAIVWIWI